MRLTCIEKLLSLILKLRKQSQGRYRRGPWIDWTLVTIVTGQWFPWQGEGEAGERHLPGNVCLNDLVGGRLFEILNPCHF